MFYIVNGNSDTLQLYLSSYCCGKLVLSGWCSISSWWSPAITANLKNSSSSFFCIYHYLFLSILVTQYKSYLEQTHDLIKSKTTLTLSKVFHLCLEIQKHVVSALWYYCLQNSVIKLLNGISTLSLSCVT